VKVVFVTEAKPGEEKRWRAVLAFHGLEVQFTGEWLGIASIAHAERPLAPHERREPARLAAGAARARAAVRAGARPPQARLADRRGIDHRGDDEWAVAVSPLLLRLDRPSAREAGYLSVRSTDRTLIGRTQLYRNRSLSAELYLQILGGFVRPAVAH
jgi:hypothetical protein